MHSLFRSTAWNSVHYNEVISCMARGCVSTLGCDHSECNRSNRCAQLSPSYISTIVAPVIIAIIWTLLSRDYTH